MELQKVLEERRSIRAYEPGHQVEKAQIEQLIQAAIYAPSWKNSQTARYYVAMSPEVTAQIRKECLPEMNQAKVTEAPVLIVSTFVSHRSGFERDGQPTNEVGEGWGFYDLGLHNENLLLKARDLGLDTLVMGIRDAEKLRSVLSIPEEEVVVAVIAVGYRAVNPDMPKRKEVAEIAKFF